MELDHIAVAVQDLETAAERLCALLGYSRRTARVTNSRQQVHVLFLLKAGSPDIKLIEPAGDASPLWPFIRKGGGLHHICFKTQGVRAACDQLVERGARLLAAPQPGEAFDDELIAFLYLGFGINLELIDTDRRRDQITEID